MRCKTAAEREDGGRSDRAGISGGNHRVGIAVFDEPHADIDGAVLLAPHCGYRRLVHRHFIRRVDYFKRIVGSLGVFRQLFLDAL